MGDIPMHLEYFEGSMFDKIKEIADRYPAYVAFDFMGRSTTYRKMVGEIEKCAKALKTIGVRENDRVTIALPNCPQAIYMFYAVNLVGSHEVVYCSLVGDVEFADIGVEKRVMAEGGLHEAEFAAQLAVASGNEDIHSVMDYGR